MISTTDQKDPKHIPGTRRSGENFYPAYSSLRFGWYIVGDAAFRYYANYDMALRTANALNGLWHLPLVQDRAVA